MKVPASEAALLHEIEPVHEIPLEFITHVVTLSLVKEISPAPIVPPPFKIILEL